jgi:transcriptional regulator with XRE-family HTH domain
MNGLPTGGHHGGARDGDVAAARSAFGSEVRRFRQLAGHTQVALAAKLGYHRSYLSKIEAGRYNPTLSFAKRADEVLRAGGAILLRWRTFHNVERPGRTTVEAESLLAQVSTRDEAVFRSGDYAIKVIKDKAVLSYDDHTYQLEILREIENLASTPVNGFPVRIHVDRFPDDPKRSREFYRANPLLWEELSFKCWYGQRESDFTGGAQVELECDSGQTITDQLIEAWVLFQGRQFGETFPLYAGHRMLFRYTYLVGDDKWGSWLQRHVRFPTDKLEVFLSFPTELRSRVWGKEKTLGRPRLWPIESQIRQTHQEDRTVWSWAIEAPHLGDRYRFEWRFDNPPAEREE